MAEELEGRPAAAIADRVYRRGWNSPLPFYLPADTASWRMRMLVHGDLPDEQLRQIRRALCLLDG